MSVLLCVVVGDRVDLGNECVAVLGHDLVTGTRFLPQLVRS